MEVQLSLHVLLEVLIGHAAVGKAMRGIGFALPGLLAVPLHLEGDGIGEEVSLRFV